MASDIERIRLSVSLVDTVRAFGVDPEEDGSEYVACCPFHEERTPSFTLFQGRKDNIWRFHCFGCDAAGDVIDFVEKIKGVSTREAIGILGGSVRAGANVPKAQKPVRNIYEGIIPIDPPHKRLAPNRNLTLYNPKRERSGNIVPSMVFAYHREDGALIGYVLRRDYVEQGRRRKETPMVMRVRMPDGQEVWSRFPFPEPRPLYRLPLIGDDRQVFVVEGEKCADAMFRLRGRASVSWVGGTRGVAHTDWSPLRGRDVVIVPDADAPGWMAANDIAEALEGVAGRIRFANVLRSSGGSENERNDVPDGGLSADSKGTLARADGRGVSLVRERGPGDRAAGADRRHHDAGGGFGEGPDSAPDHASGDGRLAYSFSDWKSGARPPGGWDVADAADDGWTREEYDAMLRASLCDALPPFPGTSPPPKDGAPRPTPPPPAGADRAVTQARTMQQEQPAPATVTSIQTRKQVAADDSWHLHLVMTDEGKLKPNIHLNWQLYLKNHREMAGVLAFDQFKYRVMLMRRPPWESPSTHWENREVRETDYARAVMWLESHYMTPKVSNIKAVLDTVAEESSFDRLHDYLEGLRWDGQARIDRWTIDYLGAADTPYSGVIGRNFLISAVARGLRPGCKVDTMPILEGPQGLKKSGALRALFSEPFFTDGLSDIGSKDAKLEMQGIWGLEVAEMHRFNAAETGEIKKFLTQQVDRFRPPYGKLVIEAPRRVVLAGTINPDGNPYLKDSTGARRFWPVTCTRIDLDGIEQDRDQLWAEAVALFKGGMRWWSEDQAELDAIVAEQTQRTDVDVWADAISQELKGRASVTQAELFKIVGIPLKDADYRHSGRIGRVMRGLGWIMDRDRAQGLDRIQYHNPGMEKPAAFW